MGHERIGFLPKTKRWQEIIDQLIQFDNSDDAISQIANGTLINVRKTYEKMPYDESVIKAVQFLIVLSMSANSKNQIAFLNQNGYLIDDHITIFSLVQSAKNLVTTENGSLESNKIVRDALLETIVSFDFNNQNNQLSLFEIRTSDIWNHIGSGAAFCELSRSFFATFTDRYLKYYLEREVARTINDYRSIEIFSQKLTEQAETISHHAFETSKIMQSFAAGWYINHTKVAIPSSTEIVGFLSITFGKIREEFRREADER